MSSAPNEMKTGQSRLADPDTLYPKTFYIILMILNAILRRSGLCDCLLYAEHNTKGCYDHKLYDTGIVFNLFSEN